MTVAIDKNFGLVELGQSDWTGLQERTEIGKSVASPSSAQSV
jgi:hypothetical protein